MTIKVRQEKTGDILEVPLFSKEYADLPVALVNDEPIPLKAFVEELSSMHSGMGAAESPHSQNFSNLLNRLIAIKLIKQEALNIGFDRTPESPEKGRKVCLENLDQAASGKADCQSSSGSASCRRALSTDGSRGQTAGLSF